MDRNDAVRLIKKKYFLKKTSEKNVPRGLIGSTWNNLPTCAIRIPQVFKEDLIEIARRLDESEVEKKSTETELISELTEILNTPVKPSKGVEILKNKIRELIEKLDPH